jgi:hypothetical protein
VVIRPPLGDQHSPVAEQQRGSDVNHARDAGGVMRNP